jgi:hypothetical protein
MSGYTLRPAADEYVPSFAGYIGKVPQGDIITILRTQIETTVGSLRALPEAKGDHAYAPDKWTIKEVVGHLADVERVMSFRALWFARADPAPLPAFDENTWAPEGRFGQRPLADLLQEFTHVRAATVALLSGLPAEAWTRRGVSNQRVLSVRALACIMAGHELHHRAILRERYGVSA